MKRLLITLKQLQGVFMRKVIVSESSIKHEYDRLCKCSQCNDFELNMFDGIKEDKKKNGK